MGRTASQGPPRRRHREEQRRRVPSKPGPQTALQAPNRDSETLPSKDLTPRSARRGAASSHLLPRGRQGVLHRGLGDRTRRPPPNPNPSLPEPAPAPQSSQGGPPRSLSVPPPRPRRHPPPPLSDLSPRGPSRQRDASIPAAQEVATEARSPEAAARGASRTGGVAPPPGNRTPHCCLRLLVVALATRLSLATAAARRCWSVSRGRGRLRAKAGDALGRAGSLESVSGMGRRAEGCVRAGCVGSQRPGSRSVGGAARPPQRPPTERPPSGPRAAPRPPRALQEVCKVRTHGPLPAASRCGPSRHRSLPGTACTPSSSQPPLSASFIVIWSRCATARNSLSLRRSSPRS